MNFWGNLESCLHHFTHILHNSINWHDSKLLSSFICPSPPLLYSYVFQLHWRCPIPGPWDLISALLTVISFLLMSSSWPSPNSAKNYIYLCFSLWIFHFSKIFLPPLIWLYHRHTHTLICSDNHAYSDFAIQVLYVLQRLNQIVPDDFTKHSSLCSSLSTLKQYHA